MISVTDLFASDVQCCKWEYSWIHRPLYQHHKTLWSRAWKQFQRNSHQDFISQIPSSPDPQYMNQIPTVRTYLLALRIPLHPGACITIDTTSNYSPAVKPIPNTQIPSHLHLPSNLEVESMFYRGSHHSDPKQRQRTHSPGFHQYRKSIAIYLDIRLKANKRQIPRIPWDPLKPRIPFKLMQSCVSKWIPFSQNFLAYVLE